MSKINTILVVLIATASAYSNHASAFCFDLSLYNESEVREYYDASTDRFFLSWLEQDIARGCPPALTHFEPPPPASSVMGLSWTTYTSMDGCDFLCREAKPLCRFRNDANPEPASYFFTISEGECEFLKRPGSGWTFIPDHVPGVQGSPRLLAFKTNPESGRCDSPRIPVYRFYNNRWQEGLSNHRYVADEGVRAEMRSRAPWTEEGVAFCVLSAQRFPHALISQAFQRNNCDAGQDANSTCVEAVNMPLPREIRGPFQAVAPIGTPQPIGYYERTGALTEYVATLPAQAASNSFVQFYDFPDVSRGAGFFVTAVDRTAGVVSGLASRSLVATSSSKDLGQPFLATYDVEMNLALSVQSFVKRIRTTGDDSQAFVFSEIVFVDDLSKKRLELNLFAIGTPPVGDFVGAYPDGNVLAVFALAPVMSYGRSVGLPMLRTSRTFDSVNGWGYGGDFGYRINRSEFERLLQRARAVQPLLSADARDYRIESFSFKGQVALTAEIGYNLQKHELSLVRP